VNDPTPGRANPRYDPLRRDRIIDACLDVIAARGLAGTSHRRVAAAAGVPLGSMTYHFAGMEELVRSAFARYASTVADRFERRLSAASGPREATDAVIAIVSEDVFTSDRDLVLTHELYTLAAREPAYRDLTTGWMRRSRDALERHFDPLTARLLDAMIEGLTLHRALSATPVDPRDTIEAIERLTREQTGPAHPGE
jgi:DNA-binding transcriptional regulator YbjK